MNRPFSYLTKESGLSDIFIDIFLRRVLLSGTEHLSLLCTFKILQNV